MLINLVKKSQNHKNKAIFAMLFIAIVFLTCVQGYLTRQNLYQKIQSEGKISAEILAAAIILNDINEIQNSIKPLNQDQDICAVHVLRSNNSELTHLYFDANKYANNCPYTRQTGHMFAQATTGIKFKDQHLGSLIITYSTMSVWLQIISFGTIASLTVLVFGLLLHSKKLAWQIELNNYQKILKNLIQKNSSLTEKINKDIAFEIHDQIGQLISTSLIRLENLQKNKCENFNEVIQIIKDNLNETYNKIRNISKELHPVIMKFGIRVALEDLAEKKFSHTNHKHEIIDELDDINLSETICINLYRIAQEAFTNILKHANASKVSTKLWLHNNSLYMSINDDGVGIKQQDFANQTKSLGLIGIAERAMHIGGFANIESTNEGTTLIITIPEINHE